MLHIATSFDKANTAQPTVKTVKTERLATCNGKPFGIILNEEELSADQLRQAIYNADHYVVVRRCPGGYLDLINGEHGGEYEFVDAVVIHHPDGSFEIAELVQS